MNLTHISIADIPIRLESTLTAEELGLERRYGPFLSGPANGETPVTVRWSEGDPNKISVGDLIYDPGSIWRMYQRGRDYVVRLNYAGEDGNTDTQAVVRANPSWDDINVSERRGGPGWQSLLNVGAGEIILRTAVIFRQGLLFHAAGVNDNGRGLLFVGHSGAGKSTQTEMWSKVPGVVAMNDDRMAVRLKDEGAMVYGTPWGGELDISKSHKSPLAAIFILEHAPHNEVRRLDHESVASMLLARSFLPFWDPGLLARCIDVIGELLDAVPVYLLSCRPEPSVIPLVRSVS
jgi:hypothetical protein